MKLSISILAIATLMIGISGSAFADINDGVVAAWTFDDGKVTDAIADAHGELFKGATITGDGKFGKALDVDGNQDSRADIEFDDRLESIIEGAHTVSYWLYVREGRNHSGVWKGEKVGWGANFTFRMVTTSDTGLTWGHAVEALKTGSPRMVPLKPISGSISARRQMVRRQLDT